MIKVLYYIPDLKQEYGGVRQYAAALLKEISEIKGISIFVYHNSADPVILDIVNANKALHLIRNEDIIIANKYKLRRKIISLTNSLFLKLLGCTIVDIYSESFFIDRLIKQFSIDIIHCPYQFIPQTKKAKLITTMHDVQELHFPKFFDANTRAYRAVNYLKFIQQSDKIVVSYNHIKRDIVEYFEKNENDIEVLLLRMDNLWFSKFSNQRAAKIHSEKYLLYPANAWRHKNHINLFKAILLSRQKYKTDIVIRLTGDFNNDYGRELNKFVIDNYISDLIHFEGIVDELRLFELYKNAHGVVIPTLYEAGSFPLMESIIMGIPVICSNVTSLPETICNDSSIFNPYDVEDIEKSIRQLWFEEKNSSRFLPSKTAMNKLIQADKAGKIYQIYYSLFQDH